MIDINNYILIGKKIIKTDLLTWAKWFENDQKRIIASTWLAGRVHISTVFLCIDHGFGMHQTPVLFETMIFGGRLDGYQVRYHTYKGAVAGHQKAIALVYKNKRPAFLLRRKRHKNRLIKLPFALQMKIKYPDGIFAKNR